MSQTPVYLVDIMAQVVTATGTALGYAKPIYYTYGPFKEIVEKMAAMAKHPDADKPRYPLIALITDIPEKKGETTAIYSEANCQLLIATFTDKNLYAEDRTAGNFKTYLYPIYQEFLAQMHAHSGLDTDDEREIAHDKFDRYNFGRSQAFIEGNAGTDFIDAIEIQNLILRVKPYNCLKFKTT